LQRADIQQRVNRHLGPPETPPPDEIPDRHFPNESNRPPERTGGNYPRNGNFHLFTMII
jgi:hypothetical protein